MSIILNRFSLQPKSDLYNTSYDLITYFQILKRIDAIKYILDIPID